jgi:GTP1/Obg family GTP-binding protein
MASLRTPTPIECGIPAIRILKVASCVTGDTVYVAGPVKSWIVSNLTTADATSASYSTTTKLFTITVANTPDIHLWIMS